MTVLEVLQSSTSYFKKRKIDNPRLNAEHLLEHVLGRKRIELYLEFGLIQSLQVAGAMHPQLTILAEAFQTTV